MPNVRLPDGRLVYVPDSDAASVVAGGATPETSDEATARVTDDLNRTAYDTPLDKVKALGEGALSGLTFGGSDWLLGEDAQNRAKYDGGWRTAGELGGMIIPALAGAPFGAASIAADTGEMAANAARGLGGMASKAVGRAAEGALYGLGAANSHAALSDDPVTVESFLAAAGSGAIFNIGLGALGDTIASRGAKAAEAVANEAKAIEQGTALEQASGKYSDILNTVKSDLRVAEQDMARKIEAMKPVRASAAATGEATVAAERPAPGSVNAASKPQEIANHISESMAKMRELQASMRFTPGAIPSAIDLSAIRAANVEATVGLAKGQIPRAAQNATKLRELVDTAMQDHAFDMAALKGTAEIPPEVPPVASSEPAAGPTKAPPTKLELKQAHQDLKATLTLPKTLPGFIKAGPEQLAAAEKALSPKAVEQLTKLASDLGVEAKPGQILQDLKSHVTELAKLERKGSAAAKDGPAGLLHKAVRFGAGVAFGRHSGVGAIGSTLLAAAVGQARAAVSGGMDAILAKMGVPLGRAVAFVAPAASRIATSKVMGNTGSGVRERATASIRAAHAAAYSAPDAYYHAVKPFIETSPRFAAALQQKGIGDHAYIAAKAPKDPGLSKAMGKTQFVVSDAQAREHNTRVWTLNNEMAAIEHLATGRPDMVMAKTLWDRRPALMQEFQARVLANFEQVKNAPYATRNALSAVLGIPMDSLNAPQYIAKMAAMDAPSEAAANPGSAPSAGSSAKSKPKQQTQVDRLTNQGT